MTDEFQRLALLFPHIIMGSSTGCPFNEKLPSVNSDLDMTDELQCLALLFPRIITGSSTGCPYGED